MHKALFEDSSCTTFKTKESDFIKPKEKGGVYIIR